MPLVCSGAPFQELQAAYSWFWHRHEKYCNESKTQSQFFRVIGVGVLSATIIIPLLKNINMSGAFLQRSLFLAVWYFTQTSTTAVCSNNQPNPSRHSRLGLVIIIAYMCSALFPTLCFGWITYREPCIFPAKFVLGAVWHRKLYRRFYCLSRFTGYLQAIKWLYGA